MYKRLVQLVFFSSHQMMSSILEHLCAFCNWAYREACVLLSSLIAWMKPGILQITCESSKNWVTQIGRKRKKKMKTSLMEKSFELGIRGVTSMNCCEVGKILCAHTCMEMAWLSWHGKNKINADDHDYNRVAHPEYRDKWRADD